MIGARVRKCALCGGHYVRNVRARAGHLTTRQHLDAQARGGMPEPSELPWRAELRRRIAARREKKLC